LSWKVVKNTLFYIIFKYILTFFPELWFKLKYALILVNKVFKLTFINLLNDIVNSLLGGPKSIRLREVSVSVISHKVCNQLFLRAGNDENLSDAFICAGDVDAGGADACEGDSGGPLVVQNR